MKITDLAKLDVKDLDVGKLIKTLSERKDIVLNLVIVGLTLSVIIYTFNNGLSEEKRLHQKMLEIKNKGADIEESKKMAFSITRFKQDAPLSLSEEQMIDFITDLAATHEVRIVAFSPANKEEFKLYSSTELRLELTAPDYKNIVTFIRDIETSKKNVKVKNLEGVLQPGRAGEEVDAQKQQVNIKLSLQTTGLKG